MSFRATFVWWGPLTLKSSGFGVKGQGLRVYGLGLLGPLLAVGLTK